MQSQSFSSVSLRAKISLQQNDLIRSTILYFSELGALFLNINKMSQTSEDLHPFSFGLSVLSFPQKGNLCPEPTPHITRP